MSEYEADLTNLAAVPSLREAIVTYLATPELFTDQDGCTLGGLMDQLADHDADDIWDAVQALINDGEAYVTVPLEIMDLDQYVFPVEWAVGRSSIAQIEAKFGPRHAERGEMGLTTLCYDLYVEEVDDDDDDEQVDGVEGHPTAPQPYPQREAANPNRPCICKFPFSAIWPPEALQLVFVFNEVGTLVDYRFTVGERHT